MFTVATNAFFCSKPVKDDQGIKAYQRGAVQNIGSVLDLIIGLGLMAAGVWFNMPILTMVGIAEICFPVQAFITIALFACKEGKSDQNIYIRLKPCGSK